MRIYATIAAFAALAGCASSGVIPTGADTYMITAKSAGGMFTNGNAVLGNLYKEANTFCASQGGKVVQSTATNAQNAIPFARMPNARLEFKCVAPTAQPASSPAAAVPALLKLHEQAIKDSFDRDMRAQAAAQASAPSP